MKSSEKIKQKIAKLMDNDFILEVLDKHLPKYYPDLKKIIGIELEPFKRHLGVTSAVFVVEYKIKYQDKEGKNKNLDIFVSAHSDGSREGAYKKTKALYRSGFDKGEFRVTRPLFFLPSQKAFFYEASVGSSFFNFFSQDPQVDLEPALKLAAGWVRKLHQLEINQRKFRWGNFSIEGMVPSPDVFIANFRDEDKKQGKLVDNLVKKMKKLEKSFNEKLEKTVIYGDYHPENIIIHDLKANYLEMIDFTDIAFGDPMTDLGTFLQQFDFMGHNFISRKKINDYKKYFVESYFGKSFDEISEDFFARINLYQSWTALRSAVFIFYMKDKDNPVGDLLMDSKEYLKLAGLRKKRIDLYS